MALWDQMRRLLGAPEEPDAAEREELKVELSVVRSTRERADTAIEELRQQAERTVQAYSAPRDIENALRRARQTMGESLSPERRP